jgi:4-hydroxybenzoate polyprenyltransferase
LWLVRGKAKLKREIARRIVIDASLLPYRMDFVAWLRTQCGSRKLILCTASDMLLAKRIAEHLGFFDGVEASDGTINLSGTEKASRLVSEFGERAFDYAGNARADLKIWTRARRAIVVGAGSRLQCRVARQTKVSETFPAMEGSAAAWLRALRLHQWAKNVLVFLAPLAAHSLFHPAVLWRAVAAWFVFGLCASGVYLLNDLLDLEADRAHPRKKDRAFASGTLPLQQALWANAILTVAAFAGAVLISPWFAIVLLSYWLLTNAYSLGIKPMAVLDVIVLAGLYTVRILAGAAATAIEPSFWLLAFSMFFFLSLAILKRYTELDAQQRRGALGSAGRGYLVADLSVLTSLGVNSILKCNT